MDEDDKMAITPDDWTTTSTSGSFTTGEEQDDTENEKQDETSKTPGFEMVLGILALFIVFVMRRRKH